MQICENTLENALAVFAVSKASVFATVCHPLPQCEQGSCDAVIAQKLVYASCRSPPFLPQPFTASCHADLPLSRHAASVKVLSFTQHISMLELAAGGAAHAFLW